jgi:hypothetical protein
MGLKRKIYIVYKGDEVITHGTLYECAQKLKVRPDTVKFYGTPAHRNRYKSGDNHLTTYYVGEEEYDHRVH